MVISHGTRSIGRKIDSDRCRVQQKHSTSFADARAEHAFVVRISGFTNEGKR